jgi:hypothetical protein
MTRRIIAFTMLTTGIVGVFVASVVVLGADSFEAETVIHSLTTFQGLVNLLTVAIVVSLPISLVAGLAGGAFASRVVRSERGTRSLASWLTHGCCWGAAIGSVGPALWFGAASLGEPTMPLLVAYMGAVGATAGCLVGGAVAIYCSRITVASVGPQNNALQLTKPAQAMELRS